jgi:hypothetical protein
MSKVPGIAQERIDLAGTRKTILASRLSLGKPELILEFLDPTHKGIEVALRYYVSSQAVMPGDAYRPA